jgi:hypothetical protein
MTTEEIQFNTIELSSSIETAIPLHILCSAHVQRVLMLQMEPGKILQVQLLRFNLVKAIQLVLSSQKVKISIIE